MKVSRAFFTLCSKKQCPYLKTGGFRNLSKDLHCKFTVPSTNTLQLYLVPNEDSSLLIVCTLKITNFTNVQKLLSELVLNKTVPSQYCLAAKNNAYVKNDTTQNSNSRVFCSVFFIRQWLKNMIASCQ